MVIDQSLSKQEKINLLMGLKAGTIHRDDFVSTVTGSSPRYEIIMHTQGTPPAPTPEEVKEIERLKAMGRYFDISLKIE